MGHDVINARNLEKIFEENQKLNSSIKELNKNIVNLKESNERFIKQSEKSSNNIYFVTVGMLFVTIIIGFVMIVDYITIINKINNTHTRIFINGTLFLLMIIIMIKAFKLKKYFKLKK